MAAVAVVVLFAAGCGSSGTKGAATEQNSNASLLDGHRVVLIYRARGGGQTVSTAALNATIDIMRKRVASIGAIADIRRTGTDQIPPLREPAPKGTVVGMWKGDGKVVAFRGKTVIFRTKPGRQGRFVLPLLPGGYEVAVRRPSGRYCPAKRVLVHAFQATRVMLTCPK